MRSRPRRCQRLCAVGGIEEWPPSDDTVSLIVAYPFSAIPMNATGCWIPSMIPWSDRPLVEDEPEPDSSTTEDFGHSSVPLATTGLFVVPE